jgi:hypothetical protein
MEAGGGLVKMTTDYNNPKRRIVNREQNHGNSKRRRNHEQHRLWYQALVI